MPQQRQYPMILDAVCNTVWACLPDRVQAIADVMNHRVSGTAFSEEEIRQRIGGVHQSNGSIGLLGLDDPEASEPFGPRVVDGVAIMPVHGVLAPKMSMFMHVSGGTSTQQLQQWIEEAATSSKVKSILLDIDSPGGDAHGNQEVVDLIREVQQSIPVHAHWTNLGASAAYYIGRACGTTSASKSTELGSIACYYVHGETSKADAADGVTYTVFRGAEFKNAANEHEPLNDKGREYLNERINGLHQQFVGSVADCCGMSIAEVEQQFGAGKLFLAEKAQTLGMVDRVATLKQVFNEMREVGKAAPRTRSTVSAAVAPHVLTSETSQMDALIKQAVIGAELVPADASDELATAALTAFFKARGTTQPETPPAVALALLGPAPTAPAPAASTAGDTSTPLDPAVIARDAVNANTARCDEIRAVGNIRSIDKETIDAFCADTNCTVAAATAAFTSISAAINKPLGVGAGGARVTGSADDKFAAACVDGLAETGLRAFVEKYEPQKLDLAATQAADMGGMEMIRQSLSLTHSPQDLFGLDDQALATLALGMPSTMDIGTNGGQISAATTLSPASLPNIMSASIAKTVNPAMTAAPGTYRRWAAMKQQDLTNYDPAEVNDVGGLSEFDRVDDDGNVPNDSLVEEPNWIEVKDYAKQLEFTPYMLIQGKLLNVIQWAANAATAHEETLNRLCINALVYGTTGDGTTLCDAAHSNIVAGGSGGTVAQAQVELIDDLLGNQQDPGGEHKLGLPLNFILVPHALRHDTKKFLDPDNRVRPANDAAGNTYMGDIQYAFDHMLDDISAVKWYGFTSKQRAIAVMFAFRKGYRNMRRRSWVKPDNQARVFRFEGSMAAAAVNYRGVAENAGA